MLALRWLVRLAPGMVPSGRIFDALVALFIGAVTIPAGRMAGVQSAGLRWVGGGVVFVGVFIATPLVMRAPGPQTVFTAEPAHAPPPPDSKVQRPGQADTQARLARVDSRRQELRDLVQAHLAAGESALAARSLLDLAALEAGEGRPADARVALLQAIEAAREGGDIAAQAEALARLGELKRKPAGSPKRRHTTAMRWRSTNKPAIRPGWPVPSCAARLERTAGYADEARSLLQPG